MRRFAFSMLAALLLFTATAAGALAAPSPEPNPAGPYEGKFRGTVWAGGSGAPLSVNLTHRGNVVAGTASLGEGLVVKSRFCGSASIPAATQQLNGYTQPGRLGHLEATTTFRAQGIPVTIYFSSDVSANGKTVNGAATLDIPWFCGSDPVLTGTLYKAT